MILNLYIIEVFSSKEEQALSFILDLPKFVNTETESEDFILINKICAPNNYKDITDFKSLFFATEKDSINFQLVFTKSNIKCSVFFADTILFNNQSDLTLLPEEFKNKVETYLMTVFTKDDVLDKKNRGLTLSDLDIKILEL